MSEVRPALPAGVAGPPGYVEQGAALLCRFCFTVLSFCDSCRLPDCERLTVYKITRDHYLAYNLEKKSRKILYKHIT